MEERGARSKSAGEVLVVHEIRFVDRADVIGLADHAAGIAHAAGVRVIVGRQVLLAPELYFVWAEAAVHALPVRGPVVADSALRAEEGSQGLAEGAVNARLGTHLARRLILRNVQILPNIALRVLILVPALQAFLIQNLVVAARVALHGQVVVPLLKAAPVLSGGSM